MMPDGHREPRIQAGNATLPRTIRNFRTVAGDFVGVNIDGYIMGFVRYSFVKNI